MILTWIGLAFSGACLAAVHTRPPAAPDPERPYLIYLHGGILTGTDGSATSPWFGDYDYAGILQRLDEAGFEVISEVRTGDDDAPRNATRIIQWIQELKAAGVPSDHIAVVGASMGGIIAGRVSHELADPAIAYVLIASLYAMDTYPPVPLSGRVLAIRDRADERTWVESAYLRPQENLTASKVVVTDTGRGHGLLYRPDDAWVLPTLAWLSPRSSDGSLP